MNDTLGKKVACIDMFNSYTMTMLKLVIKKDNDADLESGRRKLSIIINTNPAFIMEQLGEYLIMFEDKIRERDAQWFVDRSYKDLSKNEYGDLIIGKLKDKWSLCTKKERGLFADCFNAMLTIYCGYQYLKLKGEFPPEFELPALIKLPKV